MPSRITPLDVKAFANHEIYRKGEQIYENGLVGHRFQTHYGFQASVRGKGNYRVEMIVDGEKLFGRCSCPLGTSHCEHQIAILLTWLNEPLTFISFQDLRKAIRTKDKNALVDILMNLIEAFPELSQFFVTPANTDEVTAIREEVANIFDFPYSSKIDPQEIIEACQFLFVRAKTLRNENKWPHARIIYFEFIHRTLALVDQQQMAKSFRENFIAELADDYEEIAMNDPDFDLHADEIRHEAAEILEHDSAALEGVYLDQLQQKLGMVAAV